MIRGVNLGGLAVTLAVGAAGGVLARSAHLPLGLLLGSMAVVAALAIRDVRILGQQVHLPGPLRSSFVPVIGVATGGAFSPEVIGQMPGWWISVLALCLYIPLVHAVGFFIYQRGGLPVAAAFFGATPGGLIETVELGRAAGADEALLTVLQFLRLIATIVAVPLIFWALTGRVVGSASGAQMAGSGVALGWADVAVLVVAGAAGWKVAQALRFPAAQMIGPVLFSAAAHGLGLVHGVPPSSMVSVAQVVLGCGLGARFLGADHRILRRALGLAMVNTACALVLAAGFALGLHALVGEPVTGVFLAFAPGGLAEMSLVAISLQASVAYVTVHHVARIVLSVTVAKFGARWL